MLRRRGGMGGEEALLLAGPGRDAHLAELQPESGDLPPRPEPELPL